MNKEILNELKAISPLLAQMERINVFTVPAGYFSAFASDLADKLEFSEDTGKIAKVASPFTAPAGYFESLPHNIMAAIKDSNSSYEDELKDISPLLAGLDRINLFTIPSEYFENLPAKILSKLPKDGKLVAMRRLPFIRYAVAAVITGLMGLSLFTIFDNKTSNNILPKYSAQVMQQASRIAQSNSFDEELDALSGKDIEQYLKQSGQNVEAALVASVTDETNLPSQEDYLYDENTLDEFLKTMNLNN
ncbi:MAG: hypothetical protein ABIW38_12965 [Ferruginibacter sp.]